MLGPNDSDSVCSGEETDDEIPMEPEMGEMSIEKESGVEGEGEGEEYSSEVELVADLSPNPQVLATNIRDSALHTVPSR